MLFSRGRKSRTHNSLLFKLLLTTSVFTLIFGQQFAHAQTSAPGVKTDYKVYMKPALPALPAAGGKYTDPVFGTQIMRATDASDGAAPGLGTYYSHWPTFNLDSTLLLIRKGSTGDAILKHFDPASFQLVGASEPMPASIPSGGGPNWESSIWSNKDPNLIYTFSGYYTGGMKLYSYNVVTRRFTLLKDFGALGGVQDYLHQMSMSADDDVFAFSQRRAGVDEPVYYIAWRRSDDRVLAHNATGGVVNEVRVDKTGRYLAIPYNGVQPDKSRVAFLDLQTGQLEKIYWTAQDSPTGHGDMGTGMTAGWDNWSCGINVRSMTDMHHPRVVFQFKTEAGDVDWTLDFHATLLADNEDWMTVATFYDPGASGGLPHRGVFEDEIFQAALDGSGRVRRLLHTRSRIDQKTETSGYWAMPKPTVSKDGRYIAYTSNWEGSGRYDLFIASIDPAPVLSKVAPERRQVSRPRTVRAASRHRPGTRR